MFGMLNTQWDQYQLVTLSHVNAGLSGAIVTVNTPKTVRTSNGIFEGQQISCVQRK